MRNDSAFLQNKTSKLGHPNQIEERISLKHKWFSTPGEKEDRCVCVTSMIGWIGMSKWLGGLWRSSIVEEGTDSAHFRPPSRSHKQQLTGLSFPWSESHGLSTYPEHHPMHHRGGHPSPLGYKPLLVLTVLMNLKHPLCSPQPWTQPRRCGSSWAGRDVQKLVRVHQSRGQKAGREKVASLTCGSLCPFYYLLRRVRTLTWQSATIVKVRMAAQQHNIGTHGPSKASSHRDKLSSVL